MEARAPRTLIRYGEHDAWGECAPCAPKIRHSHAIAKNQVNADGEIVTQTLVHFRIEPNAAGVYCPA